MKQNWVKNTTLFIHHHWRTDRLLQWGYQLRQPPAGQQDQGEDEGDWRMRWEGMVVGFLDPMGRNGGYHGSNHCSIDVRDMCFELSALERYTVLNKAVLDQ